MIIFFKKLSAVVFAPKNRMGEKIATLMPSIDYDASKMCDWFYELAEPLLKATDL